MRWVKEQILFFHRTLTNTSPMPVIAGREVHYLPRCARGSHGPRRICRKTSLSVFGKSDGPEQERPPSLRGLADKRRGSHNDTSPEEPVKKAVTGKASLRLGKAGGSFHARRAIRHGFTSPPMFILLHGDGRVREARSNRTLDTYCSQRQYRFWRQSYCGGATRP